MAYSAVELTFETTNPFHHFGRTPWTVDRPIARPVPTQDSTTQKSWIYIHASSGIRAHNAHVRAVQDHMRLRPRGHWERHELFGDT